jgi:hypothetical protein
MSMLAAWPRSASAAATPWRWLWSDLAVKSADLYVGPRLLLPYPPLVSFAQKLKDALGRPGGDTAAEEIRVFRPDGQASL